MTDNPQHTCANTATTSDGQPPPTCPACLADPAKFPKLPVGQTDRGGSPIAFEHICGGSAKAYDCKGCYPPPTHDEAREIAQRYIDCAFKNQGKERPRHRIPADPNHCDDLRLSAYIKHQQESQQAHEREVSGLRSIRGKLEAAIGALHREGVRLTDEREDAESKLAEQIQANEALFSANKSLAESLNAAGKSLAREINAKCDLRDKFEAAERNLSALRAQFTDSDGHARRFEGEAKAAKAELSAEHELRVRYQQERNHYRERLLGDQQSTPAPVESESQGDPLLKCPYCNRFACGSQQDRDDPKQLRICRHATRLERDFLVNRVARLEGVLNATHRVIAESAKATEGAKMAPGDGGSGANCGNCGKALTEGEAADTDAQPFCYICAVENHAAYHKEAEGSVVKLEAQLRDLTVKRDELNDWREWGMKLCDPPITCDADMREKIGHDAESSGFYLQRLARVNEKLFKARDGCDEALKKLRDLTVANAKQAEVIREREAEREALLELFRELARGRYVASTATPSLATSEPKDSSPPVAPTREDGGAERSEPRRSHDTDGAGATYEPCLEFVYDTGTAVRCCSRPRGHDSAHNSRWTGDAPKDPTPPPGVPNAPVDLAAEKPREATGDFLMASDNPGDGAGADRGTWSDCGDCVLEGGYCNKHPAPREAKPAERSCYAAQARRPVVSINERCPGCGAGPGQECTDDQVRAVRTASSCPGRPAAAAKCLECGADPTEFCGAKPEQKAARRCPNPKHFGTCEGRTLECQAPRPEQKAAFAVAQPSAQELTDALSAEHVRAVLLDAARACIKAKREGKPLPDYMPIRRAVDPAPPAEVPLTRSELTAALRSFCVEFGNDTTVIGDGLGWLADELEKARK